MSAPTLKARSPAPVSTTTRTSSRRSISPAITSSRASIVGSIAFSFSGRLSVIVAIWPSMLSRTVGAVIMLISNQLVSPSRLTRQTRATSQGQELTSLAGLFASMRKALLSTLTAHWLLALSVAARTSRSAAR